MREIFPIENKRKKELDAINKEQQLYDDLVERINELSANLSNYEETTDAAIAAFSSAITTVILNATNITSETLSTDVINALSETVSNLVASNIHTTSITVDTLIDAAVATFNKITSGEATFRDVHITGDLTLDNVLDLDKLNVNEFVIATLQSTSANIDELVANLINVGSLTASTANITTENVTESTIAEANITEADITKAEIDDATIQSIQNTKLAQVVLAEADDYYVEIPGNLINGTYDVIAFDNSNNQLWAVSVHNDIAGHFIWTWTTIDTNYLQTFYTKNNKLYIKAKTNNRVNKICYKNNSYDKVLAPQIYDTFVVDDATEWRIQSLAGSWFTGYLNAEHNGNTTTAIAELQLMPVTDVADADDSTVIYNGDVAKTYKTYHPDQNVDKASDVEFDAVKISGLDGNKYLATDSTKTVEEITAAVFKGNGALDVDSAIKERKIVNADSLAHYNGKYTDANGSVNPITKLGTIDEGEWNAGNVTTPKAEADTLIGGNKNFYAGPKLSSTPTSARDIIQGAGPNIYFYESEYTADDSTKVTLTSAEIDRLQLQNFFTTVANPPTGYSSGMKYSMSLDINKVYIVKSNTHYREVLTFDKNGDGTYGEEIENTNHYSFSDTGGFMYSILPGSVGPDPLLDFEDNSLLIETETV